MYDFLGIPLANVCQRSKERQQITIEGFLLFLRTFDSVEKIKQLTLMIKPENIFDSNAFRCICLSVVEFLLCFISKDSLSSIQLTMHRFHKIQNEVVNKPTNAIPITRTVFIRKSIHMACIVQFRIVFRRNCYN